ncbi:Alpha/Beta hydrolase protein [Xylariales sp. PMI_506]|nr:Alpha/Beta hydrolase protein [Xylariales sp. PMI_506]
MTPILPLSPNPAFHFELLRAISLSRYAGCDIGDILKLAAAIKPGDMESFSEEFHKQALRVKARADAIDASRNPVSARDAYFSAATYFRCSEFYLHGNADDPRIMSRWDEAITTFDKAIALLPVPGERQVLKADGFDVPIIYYRAQQRADEVTPKPTLIALTGYDGGQEELLHIVGLAALERGWNVITFEGPGQPLVLRQQQKGFIHDWERATTPVVDFALQQPEVDAQQLGLAGFSLGGYLCVRAAAFEHRLAAVAAIDGVYDFAEAVYSILPDDAVAAFRAGDKAGMDDVIQAAFRTGTLNALQKWAIEQGLFSFRTPSSYDLFVEINKMTLKHVIHQVKCPVWVGDAEIDIFFKGQPEKVKEALGEQATLCELTNEDGAGAHCHFGALSLSTQTFLDWMNDVFWQSAK